MKKLLVVSLVLLGISLSAYSCAQVQADATTVATAICTAATQEQGSGLALSKNQTTAINTVINGCNATAQGTNLTQATAVAAIFAGLVTLQQGGLLTQIKMTALAPDDLSALRRTKALSADDLKWVLAHDIR